MASAAKKRKYDSISLKAFKTWSLSDDFTTKTDLQQTFHMTEYAS